MALPELALEAVTERDIDLLLLEELRVSPAFGRWLANQAGLALTEVDEPIGAWHSVSHPSLGESDLIVVWREPSGERIALLIENKIDAPTQPNQGERYGQRGEAGTRDGLWDRYRTCMVAPARYLEGSNDATIYHGWVSYESIRDHLLAIEGESARALHRASLLDSAIEQHRRGYSPKIDDHVTRFWHEFWTTSLERCPRLNMKEPGPKPAGAGWIWAAPSELGRNHWIAFKLLPGFVDLQIGGAAALADRIDAHCMEQLDGEVRAVVTTNSTSLRVRVEPVDVMRDFASQLEAIHSALEAAERLLDAWKRIGPEIEAMTEEV